MARLDGLLDTGRLLSLWADALAAEPWPHPAVWVHADLLPGKVLVRDDHLAGIIDWSAAGNSCLLG